MSQDTLALILLFVQIPAFIVLVLARMDII